MELIEADNITYKLAKDFKQDEELRLSFNKLTKAVFGFSLENWFQHGFWGDYYVPYSLLYNNEVVSNVSVNKIEFLFDNEKKTGVQIGTVMTDEKFRNKGLNRLLLEQVISEWKDQSDFIYLFANESVLDFYPKYNFEIVDEYQYSKSIKSPSKTLPLKKLNIYDKNDLVFLIEMVNNSIPISKVSMLNNTALILFYCLSYKKNSIFYLEEFNAIVIMDIEGNTLYLIDVFSKTPIELNDLIQAISSEIIEKVELGFTPLNESNYNKSILKQGDTLFMLKDNASFFKVNQWRFPVLSHA
jgi:GNAT superfamily N-acetyltransferase